MKSFFWILACICGVLYIAFWIWLIYVKIILKNREKQLIAESNAVAARANELPDNVRKVFLKLRDGGGKISVLAEDVDFEFENGVILNGYLIDYSWCNGNKYYIRTRDTISNPHTTLCVNIRECTEFFPSEGRKVIEESYMVHDDSHDKSVVGNYIVKSLLFGEAAGMTSAMINEANNARHANDMKQVTKRKKIPCASIEYVCNGLHRQILCPNLQYDAAFRNKIQKIALKYNVYQPTPFLNNNLDVSDANDANDANDVSIDVSAETYITPLSLSIRKSRPFGRLMLFFWI